MESYVTDLFVKVLAHFLRGRGGNCSTARRVKWNSKKMRGRFRELNKKCTNWIDNDDVNKINLHNYSLEFSTMRVMTGTRERL